MAKNSDSSGKDSLAVEDLFEVSYRRNYALAKNRCKSVRKGWLLV
ncbi:MAG: hypothetical protein R3Y47_06210 [Lachnospiraceae bacterium]